MNTRRGFREAPQPSAPTIGPAQWRLECDIDGTFAVVDVADGSFFVLGSGSLADAVSELADLGIPTEPPGLEFGSYANGDPLLPPGVLSVRALGCCDSAPDTY